MKQFYISPEVKLLGFAPMEQLADNSSVDMDELLGGADADGVSGVLPNDTDIDVNIGL